MSAGNRERAFARIQVDWRDPLVVIEVDGLPETKGSWRALPNGKMKRDNPREKGWSTTVGWAAKAAWRGRALYAHPVAIDIVFALPAPVGKKHKRDLDKLARSVCDALQKIIYVDDEQVVELHLTKIVTDPSAHGATIRVFKAGKP